MSDREPHCPFLNRADRRCSSFFSIERLQHAFEHCFHAYKACGVYQELLDERQARRSQVAAGGGAGPHHPGRFVWTTACGMPAAGAAAGAERDVSTTTSTTRYVQVRLPSAAAPGLAAPGLAAAEVARRAAAGADGYAEPVA